MLILTLVELAFSFSVFKGSYQICMFSTYGRPSVEAVCLPVVSILLCTPMSHTVIGERKSNKKVVKYRLWREEIKTCF